MSHHIVKPGDTIQMGEIGPAPIEVPTPSAVCNFLAARGWQAIGFGTGRWTHEPKKYFVLTWEQAMAMEFYEFITIGGQSGQAKT